MGIQGIDVVAILCWYHLCKRVYEGLSGLGLAKEERKKLEREILGHLWRGEHCLAIWKLWGLRGTARNAKRIDDLIGYLLRKKHQLANYDERHARGEWIASTRVEMLFGRSTGDGMTLRCRNDANFRRHRDTRFELFDDDFERGVKKFVPLASDVGDMVQCILSRGLSEVVTDLRRAKPLRDGSPPRDGEQCAAYQRNKQLPVALLPLYGLVLVGNFATSCPREQCDQQSGEFFKQRNGFLLGFFDLHDRLHGLNLLT